MHISQKCFYSQQSFINLIDDDVGKKYECDIIKTEGNWDVKKLQNGWYDYIEEKDLKIGDRLIITVDSPPNNIFVSVIESFYG
jgi:hypothetical protein